MLVLASYCFVFKDRRAILWLPLSEAGWVEFTWLICLALSRASSLLALVDVEWVWRALSPPVKYIAVMVLGWQLLGRTELKAWKLEFIFVYWKCGLLLLLQNNVLQSLHPLIPGDLSLLMFFFFQQQSEYVKELQSILPCGAFRQPTSPGCTCHQREYTFLFLSFSF